MTGPAQVGARGPTAGRAHPPELRGLQGLPRAPGPSRPCICSRGGGGRGELMGLSEDQGRPRRKAAPSRRGQRALPPGYHPPPAREACCVLQPLDTGGPEDTLGSARVGTVRARPQHRAGSWRLWASGAAPAGPAHPQRSPEASTATHRCGGGESPAGRVGGHRVVSPALPGRPPEDPLAGRGRRPCHTHPSQAEQGAGLPVPSGRRAPAADPPSKGSPGRLSRSSQRRPPAPRPLISSE